MCVFRYFHVHLGTNVTLHAQVVETGILKYLKTQYYCYYRGGGVVQWVAHLTHNLEVVGSSPIKGPRCFLEQETLPLLLSTGWL